MANVAKNLKRVRTEQKLTQDQLAERIHVTRQTISGWENGRTQPSIDMLELLGGALGVEIEELIYGKKRNVGVEDAAPRRRNAMAVALTSVGALLSAVGLILLFVRFWQDFGTAARLALAVLPLLAGAGAGLYAVFAKKENVRLREGAAVLWCAGLIATNALVNAVLELHFGFLWLALADLFLLLPLPFLLPSAAAYTVCLGLLTAAMASGDAVVYNKEPAELWLYLGLFAAGTAACAFFAFRNRLPEDLKKYTSFLALLLLPANAVGLLFQLVEVNDFLTAAVPTYFLCLFLAGKTRRTELPLRRFAAFGFTAALFILAMYTAFGGMGYELNGPAWAMLAGACLPPLILCLLLGYKDLLKNRADLAAAAGMLVAGAALFLSRGGDGLGALLASFAFGVLMIVRGVLAARIAEVNVGLVNVFAVLLLIVWEVAEDNLLLLGAPFLGAGAALLVVNRLLIRRFAKRREAFPAEGKEESPDA